MQCHTIKITQKLNIYNRFNKKLSYRREKNSASAAHMEGARPSSPLPLRSL